MASNDMEDQLLGLGEELEHSTNDDILMETANGDESNCNGEKKEERTGIISLTPTTSRNSVPDTLEINQEQKAQLKHFLSYKGRGRGQRVRSAPPGPRTRTYVGQQHQNPQLLLGQFLSGMLQPQQSPSFTFQRPQPPRFPMPTGPQQMRGFNQQRPFSAPQPQRASLLGQPGGPRGPILQCPQNFPIPFQAGINKGALLGGSRAPAKGSLLGNANVPPLSSFFQDRFPVAPFQKTPLIGNNPILQPNRMPGRLQPSFGQPPSLQRPGNPGLFGQRPLLQGQQRANLQFSARGSTQQRLPLRNVRPGLRGASPGLLQQNPSVPSLVSQVANALSMSLGLNQMRPNQMTPNMRPLTPLGQSRGRGSFGLISRMPGAPLMNRPLLQQRFPGGQAGFRMAGATRFTTNQRIQNQQAAQAYGKRWGVGIPLAQRKAKTLLEKAKLTTHHKQNSVTPAALTGIKRKSTSEEDVPSKLVKSESSGECADSEMAVLDNEASSTSVAQE